LLHGHNGGELDTTADCLPDRKSPTGFPLQGTTPTASNTEARARRWAGCDRESLLGSYPGVLGPPPSSRTTAAPPRATAGPLREPPQGSRAPTQQARTTAAPPRATAGPLREPPQGSQGPTRRAATTASRMQAMKTHYSFAMFANTYVRRKRENSESKTKVHVYIRYSTETEKHKRLPTGPAIYKRRKPFPSYTSDVNHNHQLWMKLSRSMQTRRCRSRYISVTLANAAPLHRAFVCFRIDKDVPGIQKPLLMSPSRLRRPGLGRPYVAAEASTTQPLLMAPSRLRRPGWGKQKSRY
jgi:hypothetical protein